MYKNNFVAVIKHKGKILREIDGEVSLPFGNQYSILLKNKDLKRVLVDIEVDGENVLAGKSLILDKNSSQEIKGFMRDMSVTNRFKFIHKTKEISNYRGDRIEDGFVTINYTFEKEKLQPITIVEKRGLWDRSNPDPYPKTWSCYSDTKYNSCNCNFSAPINNFEGTIDVNSEDGITVKGSKINQQYQYGNIGELESKSYVIILKLRGRTKCKKFVTKPITVKEKLRCPTCGRQSKSRSQFCYNCGTCLR